MIKERIGFIDLILRTIKKVNIIDWLKFRNKKIGQKYGMVFTIIIALFLFATIYVSYVLNNLNKKMDNLAERGEQVIALSEMASIFRDKDIRVGDYISLKQKKSIEEFEKLSREFDRLSKSIQPMLITDERKELFEEIKTNDQEINMIFQKRLIPAVNENLENSIQYLRDYSGKMRTENIGLIDKLRNNLKKEYISSVEQVKKDANKVLMLLIASVSAAIVIGGSIALLINRFVQSNLEKVVNLSDEIACGNLAVVSIDYKGNDDIGQLARSANIMADNLRKIVRQLISVSQHVKYQSTLLNTKTEELKGGSEQISVAMEGLSKDAEHQADAAFSISSLIDSLSKDILDAREEGTKANKVSESVLKISETGRKQMESTVKQMDKITSLVLHTVKQVHGLEKKTFEISHLIQVIQNISDQTRLLALNAAIEAARAGENGNGFAVVAEEVKKLSEQVNDSVNEITDIIIGIQEETQQVVKVLNEGYNQVKKGSEAVVETKDIFSHIIDSIVDMVKQIQSISSRLNEISSSSEKINHSSQEVASVSEESSARVEETTSLSHQLNDTMNEIKESARLLSSLADELEQTVHQFKM